MKLSEFDFRIWDKGINGYIKNQAILTIGNKMLVGNIHIGEMGEFEFMSENYDDDLEIELWTGFRDKGGVKIFSGDIISFRDKNYLVELNKKLELSVISRTKDYVHKMHTSKGNFKNCKVIGNIHENAELLK